MLQYLIILLQYAFSLLLYADCYHDVPLLHQCPTTLIYTTLHHHYYYVHYATLYTMYPLLLLCALCCTIHHVPIASPMCNIDYVPVCTMLHYTTCTHCCSYVHYVALYIMYSLLPLCVLCCTIHHVLIVVYNVTTFIIGIGSIIIQTIDIASLFKTTLRMVEGVASLSQCVRAFLP